MKTILMQAYDEWRALMPAGNCCGNYHFTRGADGYLTPKTDEAVCKREVAWRRYVRLREGKSNWPFNWKH